ncbi:uroporphyrinogen III synthase [Agromyces badenianii]|uniref:Uroporphyrinogen-III synthase n=1 Tax=Agromyces badenianii TaxID=2080742 RepID=A0A2S0WZK3_9MICO|nr:uroporphyrinogen-III synthase [Agromyces badenianii]AWB96700.1 uroporphyrinogen III synthase [Agromyces badenianii]PWC05971.1 uroporphyrinogen-III synthase [Agromyces badenianii]
MTGAVNLPASVGKPLAGWRVLVPRGGPWGDGVAAALRARGASPLVAPLINFAPTDDQPALEAALAKLAAGGFDWLTITSATTVDVLSSYDAVIPETTKVAAVGETTAAALVAAGYHVDIVPSEDNSARGLLEEWEAATEGRKGLRVLALRSAIAKQVLSIGLARAGHHVEAVVAYRTIGVPVSSKVADDVRSGRVDAVLVTSGSVAEQVQQQLGPIPESILVAAIGPQTKMDAAQVGLRVDVVARERTAESLIDAVVDAATAKA